MKTHKTSPAHLLFLKNRGKKIEELRRERRRWEKRNNIVANQPSGIPRPSTEAPEDFLKVAAPFNLSFISNTDEVVGFIKKLERLFKKRKKVFVVLSEVIEIDYSAIVVLLSIMVKFKAKGISFNGDFPKSSSAKSVLAKSGFLENLFKDFKNEERYEIGKSSSDGICTHAWKNVDSPLGAEIITRSSFTIWGAEKRCPGVQRVLIELMQNTNNHAEIGKFGEKHWWLSVKHIKKERKVCFSFVDFGVGVFNNLNNKTSVSKWHEWVPKLAEYFQYKDNAELLKLIMEGTMHKTVTKKHYRGKGLPGIAEVMKRKQLSRLHVITNNVFADVANNKFRLMTKSFSGTFIYWEMEESNECCAG